MAAQRDAEMQDIMPQQSQDTRRFLAHAFRDGEIKTAGTDIDKLLPPVSRFGARQVTSNPTLHRLRSVAGGQPTGHVVGWHRAGVDEALDQFAPELGDHVELVLGLHPFGHTSEVHGTGEIHHRTTMARVGDHRPPG